MTLSFSPRTLAEAHAALACGAVKVAGATDLLVVDHAHGRTHEAVVDLLGVRELHGIRLGESGLEIGACATFTEIRRSDLVTRHASLLQDAAATIGAAQIQNRATIGGNMANASPAGDSLPALLALSAAIVISGPRGRRRVPYDAFHAGYRKTVLAEDELIEFVVIPVPTPSVQMFRKVGTREAQAISKVVVGFAANRRGDTLTDVRLALGSVAATPVRLPSVEALLGSEPLSASLSDRAARLVEESITPIDDIRSTAEYRRHVAGQVVRRLLLHLMETK